MIWHSREKIIIFEFYDILPPCDDNGQPARVGAAVPSPNKSKPFLQSRSINFRRFLNLSFSIISEQGTFRDEAFNWGQVRERPIPECRVRGSIPRRSFRNSLVRERYLSRCACAIRSARLFAAPRRAVAIGAAHETSLWTGFYKTTLNSQSRITVATVYAWYIFSSSENHVYSSPRCVNRSQSL